MLLPLLLLLLLFPCQLQFVLLIDLLLVLSYYCYYLQSFSAVLEQLVAMILSLLMMIQLMSVALLLVMKVLLFLEYRIYAIDSLEHDGYGPIASS